MKQGFAFQFDPPPGWLELRDGDRLIYHGLKDEELIVSGAVIAGQGSASSYKQIRRSVIANAIEAMNRAVSHPELRVVTGVAESWTAQNLRCWVVDAETVDCATMFLQAAVEAEAGVLLATYESPSDPDARRVFATFINGVRPA